MEKSTRLLQKEERPPVSGPLNEVANIVTFERLALRFSENLTNNDGDPYSSGSTAVRFGLAKATVPFVQGWVAGPMHPADRATVSDGTHRLTVYHRDHTGELVNPAFEMAYKNRLTTVTLSVGLREVCGCGLEGCFIHLVEKTGGGERVMGGAKGRHGGCVGYPTGLFIEDGAIATLYGNKYNTGTPNGKVGIVGLIGGMPYIIGWRTASKRAGMGAKGQRDPSLIQYRYATSCKVCSRKTCWGNCTPNSHLRFFVCNTMKARTVLALDPRGEDSIADVRAALERQEGVESVIITDHPFESGGES